ncbi:antitoxin [Bathymodiolus platifrons methanotrophic gill symbiont]|nr:antitoxin [Bathymodiolus platifrons methanotrophic gill symbiont]
MALEFEKYTYRVTWSEEDGEFLGLCSEFPSLSWLAETSEKL